jgi:hypothetical protein
MNTPLSVPGAVIRVVPSTVLVVKEMIVAWAARTSAGTSAAKVSTQLPTPGDVVLLVPGGACSRRLVSFA